MTAVGNERNTADAGISCASPVCAPDAFTVAFKPFLKWPGGKRWLVQKYPGVFPTRFVRYIEPFLGGGAVYLSLAPSSALLNDVNPDVIAAYEAIKTAPDELESRLRFHQSRHNDDYYYNVRDEIPSGLVARAARVLYLNRTCFNGIYRVNAAGKFNVPRGTKERVVYADDRFRELSSLLNSATLTLGDFEAVVSRAGVGDFVFADPPYTVRHNYNGFVKYNERLFSWSDQVRLADSLLKAHLRGAMILCTNADHASVRELYDSAAFSIASLSRYSSISASPQSRKHFTEIVIRNYGERHELGFTRQQPGHPGKHDGCAPHFS